jgi:hypothetical protein
MSVCSTTFLQYMEISSLISYCRNKVYGYTCKEGRNLEHNLQGLVILLVLWTRTASLLEIFCLPFIHFIYAL